MILRGIGASGGVGMGPAVCLRAAAPDRAGRGYAGVEDERARLRAASCQVERETAALAERMRVRAGESEPAILTGQITMLRDPELELQLDRAIQEGETAEAAVDAVFGGYIRLFEGLEDERMRLRAADIRDLQSRLLRALLGRREADLSRLPAGCVLVTRELTPSMAVGLDRERVAAILTETGGSASHAAILARALGIPAVLGAAGALQAVENGELVLVDGDAGTALPRPGRKEQEEYRTRRAALLRRQARLEPFRRRPTVDGDGRRRRLYANVGATRQRLSRPPERGRRGSACCAPSSSFWTGRNRPRRRSSWRPIWRRRGPFPGARW